jgi:hypothetical protein
LNALNAGILAKCNALRILARNPKRTDAAGTHKSERAACGELLDHLTIRRQVRYVQMRAIGDGSPTEK